MRRISLATLAAVTSLIAFAGSNAAAAKHSCRTVVVHATNSNAVPKKQASVSVHRCDRIKVEFVFATQATLVYMWRVTHKPAKKVLKLVSHGYGKNTTDTGTQVWVYRAVGKGKTYVKFGDFTPSYPHQPAADTFKLKATVR
jgi:predicted secreted protein